MQISNRAFRIAEKQRAKSYVRFNNVSRSYSSCGPIQNQNKSLATISGERAVTTANTNRPKPSDLLEPKRGMTRIRLEKFKVLIGELSDLGRKLPVMKPEFRRSKVIQSRVQRPASKSSSAR